MTNTIKIFATDSSIRKDDKWNLPFIRVGTWNSDSSIRCNVNDNIEDYHLPASELDSIYWISRHLEDFGNPKYIGICHYRRFFTLSTNKALIQIQDKWPNEDQYLSDIDQYNIMTKHNIDMLIPYPFIENFHTNRDVQTNSIWEESYQQGLDDKTGLTLNHYKLAFDNLLKFSPDYLKSKVINAFKPQPVHFGSIFTFKRELFDLYSSIILKALFNTICEIGESALYESNSRSLGYLLERMTSVLIYAFKDCGYKYFNIPLLVTNCNNHPTNRLKITKDVFKMRFNEFKERFYVNV